MKWFRLYDEIQYDTKLRRMPIAHRYAFIVLLCMANRSSVRGVIVNLDDDDLAFELEMEKEDWLTLKAKFRTKGLIEFVEGGIKISKWDTRQFASDSSAERVRAYREKNKKRDCNVTETEQKRDCNTPYVSVSESDLNSGSGSGEKKAEKSEPKKKPSKQESQQIVNTYNSVKPELWSKVTKLTDSRAKTIAKFWRENNRDVEFCKALISQACASAKLDRWWSGQSGDYVAGSFESLFRDTGEGPRYQRFADRIVSREIDYEAVHNCELSDIQLQQAQEKYQQKQQTQADPKAAAYERYKAAKAAREANRQELKAC